MRTHLLLTLVSLMLCRETLVAADKTQDVAEAPAPGRFKVGQRWEYELEGPRPGAVKPDPIDGRRILHVVSQGQQNGQKVWVIEERFTHDPNVTGLLHVDDEGMLRSLDITSKKGEGTRLVYEPAMAYQAPMMAVGEHKTLETTLRAGDGDFAMPMSVEVSRLEDETVVTAAGRFEACRHYENVTQFSIDLKVAKIPVREKRHRWYSEEVHGLIKEVYEKESGKFLTWSWEGYTSTSTLVSFGVEEVDANAVATTELAAAGSGQWRNRGANKPVLLLTLIGIAATLLAGVCIAVGVRVVRCRR